MSNDDTSTYINNYFCTIGNVLSSSISDPPQSIMDEFDEKCAQNHMNVDRLVMQPVTLDEVLKEISQIAIYKSSGLDKLSSKLQGCL